MTVTVIGQRPDGPIVMRSVDYATFKNAFGPYAAFLLRHAQRQTVVIEGHKVRLRVDP